MMFLAMHLNDFAQTITLLALQSFAPYCEVLLLDGDNIVSMKDTRVKKIIQALYLILNRETDLIDLTERTDPNRL